MKYFGTTEFTLNNGTIDEVKNLEYDAYLLNVTPAIAENFLKATIGNRKLNTNNRDSLARDIENDNYHYDVAGSGIAFNKEGKLVNGHHTLNAIISTDKAVVVTMLVGCNHLEHIDTGKTRSIKDSLRMSNNENLEKYSPMVKNILRYYHGMTITNRGWGGEFPREEFVVFGNKNFDKIKKVYEDDRTLRRGGKCISGYNKVEVAVLGAIVYKLIYIDGNSENLVKDFIYGAISINTQSNAIVEKVRNKLLRDSMKAKKNERMDFEEFQDFIFSNFDRYKTSLKCYR